MRLAASIVKIRSWFRGSSSSPLANHWDEESQDADSPPPYSQDDRPRYLCHEDSLLALERVSHLETILMLTDEEMAMYVAYHGGAEHHEFMSLWASAQLGYQMFATMTLFQLGSVAMNTVESWPSQTKKRIRKVFFELDPNVAAALSGLVCVVSVLHRGLTDSDRLFYLDQAERCLEDLIDLNRCQDCQECMAAVVLESATFRDVQAVLDEELFRTTLRYCGSLAEDLQSGFVSGFHGVR
jgi:hypothetical protein